MTVVTICYNFGAPQNSLSLFPLFLHLFAMKWWDQMPWSLFLNVKPTFSLSSFTFIKRLFSSSSLSAIKVVSSAYLRSLMFLLAILIPACDSPSLIFCVMCSAYKLSKQGNNIQPLCTPFPFYTNLLFHVCFKCCFLTCIQVSQEAGKFTWYFCL